MRAHLNGVEKFDNTLPIDTTASGSNEKDYASHFSDAEYALVKPFTYSTSVFVNNSQSGTVTNYATTDRFWLPSGNYSYNKVLGALLILIYSIKSLCINSKREYLIICRLFE